MLSTRVIEDETDPFLVYRDQGEMAADLVMRRFMLENTPPAAVYHQGDSAYALIIPSRQGSRLLTVPAANEADFIYHGDAAAGGKELADFIVATVKESGADHVRLPLLSERQMTWLRDRLTARMTDWLWNGALTSIAPLATGNMRQTSRLRRSIARAERDGLIFACGPYMDPQEVQTLHTKRWGEANRPKKFFHMLEALLSSGCAEFITLRSSDGNLIAGQLDILGSASRHFYYSVADTDLRKGCGTAVLGMSWRSFAADHRQNMYSFGRGAERYKYQYATGYRELFELRGFFAPV